MKRTFKRTALGVAAVLLLAATAVAAAASPAPSAPPVTYRIGITQDYDGMNPFSSWSSVTWESFRLGYDFLTWYDEDYEPAPDLATSWDTSPDGKTWTFAIREGMTWHDGVPLTAADIAFTYNLILDTEHWAYIQYLTGVTSVTAPDAATLVIETRKPNAGMLALYIPILPEHIW
ncbi:MAG: ABC transporter substrate-binding protein, partial [Thermoleophilia bacterium]|nr:ABC transporter substrate-binding protein [Thermoleophilia bacterium]